MGLRESDTELKAKFDAAIQSMKDDGTLNALIKIQELLSVADVLAARTIVEPLTLPMCSPIGDGAAAVILVSERKARELGGLNRKVRVASFALVLDGHHPGRVRRWAGGHAGL